MFVVRSAQPTRMEWTEENLLRLIDIYKQYPVLWNPANEDYYKKPKKLDAWKEISSQMGAAEEDCKKKVISLLSSFRREKSREKTSTGSGAGKLLVFHQIIVYRCEEMTRSVACHDRRYQSIHEVPKSIVF